MVSRILKLLALVTVFLSSYSVFATHYMGGEVTYEYLDNAGPAGNPFRYRITYNIYIYCGPGSNFPTGDNGQISIGIYDANTGNLIDPFDGVNGVTRYQGTVNNTLTNITPEVPPGCNIPGISTFCVTLNTYEQIVNLPLSIDGYVVTHERCCRNNAIDNLSNAGAQAHALYTFIPSLIYNNTSPQFNNIAIPVLCTGDTTTIVNNAFDPDGDILQYEFVAPPRATVSNQGFNIAPDFVNTVPNYNTPTNTLNYVPGSSVASPFGPGSYAFIDGNTGLTQYMAPNPGNYVVVVEIKEYRPFLDTSILIGTTRRDLQFIVSNNCPLNSTPTISSVENGGSTFININEGDSVHLTIQSNDLDLDSIQVVASGAILDSTSTYTGPLATFTSDTTTNPYKGYFDWRTECGMAGSYQFTISSRDNGCPPKNNYTVYTVNVLPFQASPITGPDSLCSLDDSSLFTTTLKTGSSYNWSINNGTLNNISADSTQINVNWTNAGIGRIEMYETSESGCVDTTLKLVSLKGAEFIDATGDTSICNGDSVNLMATGSGDYLWSPAIFISDSTLSNPTVFPDTTTPFIVSSLTNNCFKPDTVIIEVNNFEAVIPSDTTCMRDSIMLGTPLVAGYTYNWSSTDHLLNDTTIAQPIFFSDSSGIFSLNISTVDSNMCEDVDTITVLVNPTPDSVAIFGGISLCPDVTGIEYHVNDTNIVGYTWFVDSGSVVSGQFTDSILVDWGAATNNAAVKIIPTNTFGCIGDTSKLDVIINPILQTETPKGPDTLCAFDVNNLNYSITNINGSTYTWNVIGGNINSGQTSNAVNLNWQGDTTAYVFIQEVVNTSSSVCLGQSDTLNITIYASPDTTLPINGDSSICSFEQSLGYTLNGLDSSIYSWVVNTGGTLTNGQGTDSITIDWDSAGVYPITVIETTQNGCLGRILNKNITVRPLPNTSASTGTYIICPENLDSIAYTISGLVNSTYDWQVIGGNIIQTNSNSVLVSWDSTFNKQIRVFETSEYGCTEDTLILDIIYDPSNVELNYVSHNLNDASLIDLNWFYPSDSISNDLTLFRRQIKPSVSAWDSVANISNVLFDYSDTPPNMGSIYEYYLSTKNLCGSNVNTLIHNNILLNVIGDESSATNNLSWNNYQDWSEREGVKEYNIYRNLDGEGYELYQSTGSLDSAIEFMNARDGFNHCYRIEAIQEFDNSISSWSNEVCVTFNHLIHVYNALTPNGDGKNETLYAENIELYPNNTLEVYNRWGNLVYDANGYRNEWNGGDLPDGTYFYVLKIDGIEEAFRGDVLIQR